MSKRFTSVIDLSDFSIEECIDEPGCYAIVNLHTDDVAYEHGERRAHALAAQLQREWNADPRNA